ncbi:MAG: homoserine kinase [Bacteroidetes bacterium]|nr:homoserine kinase [Bacteroidota bacterium]MDA0903088.1 homoserine kinase [Bacteroidota bacterium]MDA1241702.1 homoserine kinase [Bacteroidota bacterium]
MPSSESLRVWAPATVANLNVGFDALGCALCEPGEWMDFRRVSEPGVHLVNGPGTLLPLEVHQNVAGVAARSLMKALDVSWGVEITVHKSIKPGSGIGSSAASAVAAVVGIDALAESGMRKDELLPFALDGEAVASGARHADNVAPALMGGLTLVDPEGRVSALPIPHSWHMVVLHPQVEIKTSASRAVLPVHVTLDEAVKQASWLGKFVHELHVGRELEAMYCLEDLWVGPHRSPLLPCWDATRSAAMNAGARAGGISGSGPSSFWVCLSASDAQRVAAALSEVMNVAKLSHNLHVTTLSTQGAHVVSQSV